MKYDHKKIEKKWQKKWEKAKLYLVEDDVKGKENFYTLVEFPYPSGNLHVGHWYAFSVPDIFARMQKMQGKNVLFPIGFDAFGLPAENAALQRKLNPRKWTLGNIEYMKKQIATMGASFDWSREIVTCDPQYYKWTQWIFLQFFRKGLAYQAETNVNWCPSCKTVLANEQVIAGLCERCDTEVEQRKMKQWQLKITDYAEKLLEGLEKLNWPKEIKDSQRNWIGRSEGAEIDFRLKVKDLRVKRFVLLHGRGGSPKEKFFPWLAEELKKQGFEVEAPQMPGGETPNDLAQAEYVKKHCHLDESTVILGHSFGGIVAMRLLEQDVKLGQVILLATPYSGRFLDKKLRPTVTAAAQKGFDFDKIKKGCRNFVALYGTNDSVVPMSDGEEFANKLGINLIKVQSEQLHFLGDEEPEVLRAVLPPPLNLPLGQGEKIRVFTTRPDTIFGATYLVLAPEHEFISEIKNQNAKSQFKVQNWGEIEKYIRDTKKKTELQRTAVEKDKTGVELKGLKAINPATKEEIPIWIADYVLMGYGTGAIMAVPAHDERDFEFAKKYGLEIRKVVEENSPFAPSLIKEGVGGVQCFKGEGKLINSGKFTGMDSERAKWEITGFVKGVKKVQYKIRDWVVSRQRYWGTPIPVVHCPSCGVVAVAEKDLPVKLPEIKDYKPRGDGKSPLAKAEKWVKVKCPKCGESAERETDTLDTFVDSSWYFLRYTDPKNKKEFASPQKMAKWMPVDVYSGGAEHTTMHLLYSRFWIKAMHDLGLVARDEPYVKRMNRGLILGPDGQKMSKSRGNVVDPDDYVKKLGADTVRMYLAFIGPYNEVGAYPWNPKGIMGIRRFLEKAWRVFQERPLPNPPHLLGREKGEETLSPGDVERRREVERLLHKTIKKVTEDIQNFKFNTAISALMILANELTADSSGLNTDKHGKKNLEIFLKLLAPFAPHLAEELWQELHGQERTQKEPRTRTDKGQRLSASVHEQRWPKYDEKLIKEDLVQVVVQVNGKLRATVKMPVETSEKEAKELASRDSNVQRHLAGKKIKNVIYVPGKITNFVTN